MPHGAREGGWLPDLVYTGETFEAGLAFFADATGRITRFSREPADLAAGVNQGLERSGVWLGKMPVTVQAGVASGPPGTDAIGRLADLATNGLQQGAYPPSEGA